MSFKSNIEDTTQNNKAIIVDLILRKYAECKDSCFLRAAIHHLKVYEKYFKLLEKEGKGAFPSRLEYQKFAVAKLFIDKIGFLEFSLDSSLKGFKQYKDVVSPLDAFSVTQDLKETRKITFLHNINKGDILHLKVIEDSGGEYKLLVINKYNENERVLDYDICAFMLKNYLLEKLPKPLEIGDFIRAVVLGRVKMEDNKFSKLLVSFNKNLVNAKYENVMLGIVLECDIPFYPEDISKYSSFVNYMKANKISSTPQEMIKCMFSLGVDPYKTYSFLKSADGKKRSAPREVDASVIQLETELKSMKLTEEAEDKMLKGADPQCIIQLLDKALEIYPWNDDALATRGRLKCLGHNSDFPGAIQDIKKSLELNNYNITAIREYRKILQASINLYEDNANKVKADEIMEAYTQIKQKFDENKKAPPGSFPSSSHPDSEDTQRDFFFMFNEYEKLQQGFK